MHKTWVSSVVAGLLVLAPMAAIAQSGAGGGSAETVEVTDDGQGAEALAPVPETATLAPVPETATDRPDDDHGMRVSTVAQCAPTGELDVEGFANHGAFVSAVAKGETIDVPGAGTFDLSTAEGVQALCDWASSTHEPSSNEAVRVESSGDEAEGRPADAGPPADAGKPADTGKPADEGEPADTGSADAGSSDAGPPADAGKPAHAGPPAEVGATSRGQSNGKGR